MRNSNLEILRILSMLTILTAHFSIFSNLFADVNGGELLLVRVMSSGSRIAVNVFLLIGTWFMVDAPFRPMHAIRLYLILVFYSSLLTVLGLVLGMPLGVQQIVPGFFPFICLSAWFASAYISLILLAPFLQHVVELKKNRLRLLCIVLFVLVSGMSSATFTGQIDYLGDFLWFAVVYVLMGYLKHHTDFFARFGEAWFLVGGTCCYCGIVFFEFLMPDTLIASLCRNWLENIRSIPNFALALCVFAFCIRRKPNSVKVVDWLARPAFSVYIIQAVPTVGMVLWPMLRERAPFPVDGSVGIAANLIVVPIGMYVVGGLVDGMRRNVFERWLLRCALVRKLDELLQRLYAPIVNVPMAGIAGDEPTKCRVDS